MNIINSAVAGQNPIYAYSATNAVIPAHYSIAAPKRSVRRKYVRVWQIQNTMTKKKIYIYNDTITIDEVCVCGLMVDHISICSVLNIIASQCIGCERERIICYK